jgi:hypothetical protein
MSYESTIPSSSACFFRPGPLWISVACFALSIYAHYPCRLACFADDFFGLWFLRAMLDSLDVPSFDSPSSPMGVCLSSMRRLLHCHWSTHFLLPVSFYCCGLLCYDLLWHAVLFLVVSRPVSISSSIDCGLTLQVLKTLHAMMTLKMRILDYHLFFVVLPFFKCNAIAYALHLRGGVKEY